jgi:hypothetical protein
LSQFSPEILRSLSTLSKVQPQLHPDRSPIEMVKRTFGCYHFSLQPQFILIGYHSSLKANFLGYKVFLYSPLF